MAISLLIIFSTIFAGYFALAHRQQPQAEASPLSKARYVGFPKMLFPPIDQSVVGWWKLNDAAGQTVVKDWSASGNTGTSANNITSATGYTGVANTAMSFNGTSDWVDLGNATILNPTTAMTVSIWIKGNSISAAAFYIGRDDETDGRAYAVGLLNSRLQLQINGLATINNQGATLTNGVWYHVVAVGDSSSGWKLYLNGVVDGTAGWVTPNSVVANTNIGRRSYSGSEGYFNGSISDVRIYNRVLSANEVKGLYIRGRP